jgi:TM2 domain-containing membrane protein YozV
MSSGSPFNQPPAWPQQQTTQVVHVYHAKSAGTAAMLEVVFGLLLQTFGIGHMYAGRVGVGLAIMFGYWALMAVNLLLCLVLIGFVTLPVCWLVAMIVSPLMAARSVSEGA